MKRAYISDHVIRRLPRYLRKLDELEMAGVNRISSAQLGEMLGITSSQVRQDFSCFGAFGQQGYGYNVAELRKQISLILGMDRGLQAILVGAGNIGRALMDNFCFDAWGLHLVCAFDSDESKIGTVVNGVPIKAADDMVKFLQENKIDAAVLTVPKAVAVKVTEDLRENGVEAVWNFTNTEIVEPGSNMIVENVHFSDSLLSLAYYIAERRDNTRR